MNAIVKHVETVPTLSLSDMERMADAVARSRLFGMQTKEQALVLMAISQAEGRHPVLAARDYDIIQNRPAKKAEAMLRDFLSAGGKVEWHALTDEIADATFAHPSGGSVRISWDIARAKQAGLSGKDMYHKFPRQMLRSRTVSEGVRTVYPIATSGMYVPEEVPEQPHREPPHQPTIEGRVEQAQPTMGQIIGDSIPALDEPQEDRVAAGAEALIAKFAAIQSDVAWTGLDADKTIRKQRDYLRENRPELSARVESAIAAAFERVAAPAEEGV